MSIEILNETTAELDLDSVHDLGVHVLAAMQVNPNVDVTIRMVDEQTMADLHVQWMDLPGPTDVMSFPMDEIAPGDDTEGILGDIVMCPAVASEQAQAAGHTMQDEIFLLTVHGLLHLMGYDHAEPAEKAEMFALQRRLLLTWFAKIEPGRSSVPEPTET